ncbi:MAG: hypothetical protein OXG56_05765 [Gammaproteobacteria bacterium]|nr:hypothetical protein [Gammaproteobacteria bacterium]
MKNILEWDPDHLGYDPHPELDNWRGTASPPIDHPLVRSPERWKIAGRVWWNGPPWTVLRNASCYLWHVMDYGNTEDLRFTLRDLPPTLWIYALDQARPGVVSKGSYVLWSLVFERMALDDPCDWPDTAHALDCRMLAHDSRERMYERHRNYRRHAQVRPMDEKPEPESG